MEKMFYKCTNLISLNLSSFDLSKVDKIHYMFAECKNLINLNLSNFIISNKLDFTHLFEGCSSLEFLFFLDLDVNKGNNFYDIFTETNKNLKFV
jgi:surface protein